MTPSLHLRRFGSGPRPLLALHCALAHGGEWRALAARLAEVRIVAPDLPGHGQSPDRAEQGRDHDQATRAVAALAETMGQGAPLDILGHSYGATLALRLALERPERVRSLVLIEPVLFAAARANEPAAFAAHLVRGAAARAAFAAGDAEGAARLFYAEWGQGRLDDLPLRQRRYIVQRIGQVMDQDAMLNDDAAGILGHQRLEALGLPALLVEGTASPPVIGAITRELARRLPMAVSAQVAGAGHMLPVTHPDALAAAVTAHLARA